MRGSKGNEGCEEGVYYFSSGPVSKAGTHIHLREFVNILASNHWKFEKCK